MSDPYAKTRLDRILDEIRDSAEISSALTSALTDLTSWCSELQDRLDAQTSKYLLIVNAKTSYWFDSAAEACEAAQGHAYTEVISVIVDRHLPD